MIYKAVPRFDVEERRFARSTPLSHAASLFFAVGAKSERQTLPGHSIKVTRPESSQENDPDRRRRVVLSRTITWPHFAQSQSKPQFVIGSVVDLTRFSRCTVANGGVNTLLEI